MSTDFLDDSAQASQSTIFNGNSQRMDFLDDSVFGESYNSQNVSNNDNGNLQPGVLDDLPDVEASRSTFEPTLLDDIANKRDFCAADQVNKMTRQQVLHHLSSLDANYDQNKPDRRLRKILIDHANSFHGMHEYVHNMTKFDMDNIANLGNLYIATFEKANIEDHRRGFAKAYLRRFDYVPNLCHYLMHDLITRSNKSLQTLKEEYNNVFSPKSNTE